MFAHNRGDSAMSRFSGVRFDRRGMIAGLLLASALAGCGKGGEAPPAPSGDVAKIAAEKGIEKSDLKLGFIKLTDIAPLVIAKEKGFFAEEGLNVTLEPQANWKVLLDGVVSGQLDGAHMLAGQVLASGAGIGARTPLVTPFSLDINGKGVTLSNKVLAEIMPTLPKGADGKPVHPISAAALKPVVARYKAEGKAFKMGMVFPVSTHNYVLRAG